VRKPRKVKLKKEHDPKHWAEQYREKYGAAANPMGYGRAVFERSKQLGLAETVETLTALEQSGVSGIRRLLVAANSAAADASGVPADRVAAARLLAQHVRLLGMARDVPDMAKGTRSSTLKDALAKNRAWWSHLSSGRLDLPWVDWKKINADRGYYSPSRRAVHIGPKRIAETAIHEYAHAVEHIGNLAGKAKAFVAARTKGESLRRLAVLLPGHGYGRDEVARPDDFISPYIGKEYPRSDLSEVPSTLCGMIADGQLPEVLAKDPESAFFVLGWLVGS
ncbi:MAG TPA: hypothetical protein VFH17_07665, partial [Coriobacteriia bacterium]|nr:hypothetical protein [Coriobacteriia bacterium]